MFLSKQSYFIRRFRCFVNPFLYLVTQLHAGAFAADQALERFRLEAVEAWSKIEMQSAIGSGLIQMDYEVIEAGKKTRTPARQMLYYRNKQKIRIDSIIQADPPTTFSLIAGDSYGARLQKDITGTTYRVEWLGNTSDATKSVRESTYFPIGFNAPWSLWSTPLRTIVERKEFRSHGAEEIDINGKKRIIIKFECVTEDPAIRIYDATVTMSPEDHWAIVEAEFVVTPVRDWKYRILNEFERQADGLIVRRSTTISTIALKSDTQSHRTFRFNNIDVFTPPDKKFMLTDFGLPEPVDGINSNYTSKTHLWLFACAILLFSIAFGLNRAARGAA